MEEAPPESASAGDGARAQQPAGELTRALLEQWAASCLELALALLMREVRWRCSNRQLSLVRLAIGHDSGSALQDVAPGVPLSVFRRLGQGQVITSLGGA